MRFPVEALSGLEGILLAMFGVLTLWVLVSLPVYVSAKLVVGERITLGRAMLATLLGPLVSLSVSAISASLLGELGFISSSLPAVIAFIVFLGVYKSIFNTGWVRAFGIAVVAVLVLIVLSLLIEVFFSFLPYRGIRYI